MVPHIPCLFERPAWPFGNVEILQKCSVNPQFAYPLQMYLMHKFPFLSLCRSLFFFLRGQNTTSDPMFLLTSHHDWPAVWSWEKKRSGVQPGETVWKYAPLFPYLNNIVPPNKHKHIWFPIWSDNSSALRACWFMETRHLLKFEF